MFLKQLARILPGYVVLYVHSNTKGWRILASSIEEHEELSEAVVTKAIPLESYAMEVSITTEEDN